MINASLSSLVSPEAPLYPVSPEVAVSRAVLRSFFLEQNRLASLESEDTHLNEISRTIMYQLDEAGHVFPFFTGMAAARAIIHSTLPPEVQPPQLSHIGASVIGEAIRQTYADVADEVIAGYTADPRGFPADRPSVTTALWGVFSPFLEAETALRNVVERVTSSRSEQQGIEHAFLLGASVAVAVGHIARQSEDALRAFYNK